MDVLHFMKEEYLTIRSQSLGLLPCDLAESISENDLLSFMGHLDLMLRVGDELIISELTDAQSRHLTIGTHAEVQSAELQRFLITFKRSKTVPVSKREDLFNKISRHIDYMEQFVLPIIREMIPTATREEIGEIAVDYRHEAGALLSNRSKGRAGSTISA